MAENVRVIIVDDSSFFRNRIKTVLEASAEITVVAEAANGKEALELTKLHSPDLVTMDVAMPVMDGIDATREIMREHPTDIIMFSALTQEGARSTLDALEAGAIDFVSKLPDPSQGNTEQVGDLLRDRILQIARTSRRRHYTKAMDSATIVQTPVSSQKVIPQSSLKLVLIGASTGGPIAVQKVLTTLPENYPFPVLVAVHMPSAFTGTYAKRLNEFCSLEIAEAKHGDKLKKGKVFIAPGGLQTTVSVRHSEIFIDINDKEGFLYKPCIDNTFASAAACIGDSILAVVMTGMGSDGTEGAKKLKEAGSIIWSQDESTSVVYGMPKSVFQSGIVERVLPLNEIGQQLKEIS